MSRDLVDLDDRMDLANEAAVVRELLASRTPMPAPQSRTATLVAPCPRISRRVVSRYPRHATTVTSLPPAEQDKIRAAAQHILASFRVGCTPVRSIGIIGHADRDRRQGRPFEERISVVRAHAVQQVLHAFLRAPSIIGRIRWQVLGAGAVSPVIPNPASEQERALNRRVEIFLGPIPIDGTITSVSVDEAGASLSFVSQGPPRPGEFELELYRNEPSQPVPLLPRAEWMRRGAVLGLAQRALSAGHRVRLVLAGGRIRSIELHRS